MSLESLKYLVPPTSCEKNDYIPEKKSRTVYKLSHISNNSLLNAEK